jgi:hypothetical protein
MHRAQPLPPESSIYCRVKPPCVKELPLWKFPNLSRPIVPRDDESY